MGLFTTKTLPELRTNFGAKYPYLKVVITEPTDEEKAKQTEERGKPASAEVTAVAKKLFPKAPSDSTELVQLDTSTSADGPRGLKLQDRNSDIHDQDRFFNSLAAFCVNLEAGLTEIPSISKLADHIAVLTTRIEGVVNQHLTNILDSEPLRTLEKNW